jgi:hypothetical protein
MRSRERLSSRMNPGFTRFDLMGTVAAAFLAGIIALPLLGSNTQSAGLAGCLNNLRQVGQAMRIWALDRGAFNWEVSVSQGGTGLSLNTWEHFLIYSNLVSSPRVFACPSDDRQPARDFSMSPGGLAWPAGGENNAVSYFIGLDTLFDRHTMILSGDRHLIGGSDYVGCRNLPSPMAYAVTRAQGQANALQWTNAMHGQNAGNLLFNDGRAASTTSRGLNRAVEDSEPSGNYNHHLLPPR